MTDAPTLDATTTDATADLDALERETFARIDAASSEAEIEAARVGILGKKGTLSERMKTLGRMAPDERKVMGPALNGLKSRATDAIAARKAALEAEALERRLETERADVSLPVRPGPASRGRIHPVTRVTDELTAIFADMGFEIAEGPEIETDHYNFTALNFPPGHPAREMHDTFFLPAAKRDDPASGEGEERLVLRTHTSPVQVRTMEAQEPPIRIVIPGKTYRQDSDPTHTPMFHQLEGLVIDRSANLANLKWVLAEMCRAFFEVERVEMRFRPSFFPFTEPSMEVDIQCDRSGDQVCFGQGTDWDGDIGLWHGPPQRAARGRAGPGGLSGLRLGRRHRPAGHAQIRHARPAPLLRG